MLYLFKSKSSAKNIFFAEFSTEDDELISIDFQNLTPLAQESLKTEEKVKVAVPILLKEYDWVLLFIEFDRDEGGEKEPEIFYYDPKNRNFPESLFDQLDLAFPDASVTSRRIKPSKLDQSVFSSRWVVAKIEELFKTVSIICRRKSP